MKRLLILILSLFLSGCATITITHEIDHNKRLSYRSFVISSDELTVIQSLAPRIQEDFQKTYNPDYSFFLLNLDSPPYYVGVSEDFTLARKIGYTGNPGGNLFISSEGVLFRNIWEDMKSQDLPISPMFRSITSYVGGFENPSVGFLSKDRRTHTLLAPLEDLEDYSLTFKR